MSDLISRQAAIGALYDVMFDDDLKPTIVTAKQADTIMDAVRKLPSAQSSFSRDQENDHSAEVIKMAAEMVVQPELCDYYALCRHGRDENKLRARLKFCEYCNEDSDGYVKPIEKNNHAFVRFGMNGWELDLHAKSWHGSAKIRYCPMCGRDLLVK